VLTLVLSVNETVRHGKITAVTAATKVKKRIVVVGAASITVAAGGAERVHLSLNRTGARLLNQRRGLAVKLVVSQSGHTVSSRTISFKAKPVAKHKHKR
jgi:hypothetical protein